MTYKELEKYTKKFTVLYAEDDKMTANIISEILKGLFKKVTTVSNGQDALDEYEKKEYDLVLLDIEMPKINGIDAAKRIKFANGKQSILFLSAYDEVKYIRGAIDIGANDYILKPLDEQDFFSKIYNVIQEKLEQKELIEDHKKFSNKDVTVKANIEHDLKDINILFITETLDTKKSDKVYLFLKELVKCVLVEDDASLAFKKYKQDIDEKIDLIILDTELLRVKGFAFISSIRKINKNIPYLFISKNDANNSLLYQRFSKIEYLVKPINYSDLLAKIYKLSYYHVFEQISFEHAVIDTSDTEIKYKLTHEDLDEIICLADDFEIFISDMISNVDIQKYNNIDLLRLHKLLHKAYNVLYMFIAEDIQKRLEPFAISILSVTNCLDNINVDEPRTNTEVVSETLILILEDLLAFIEKIIDKGKYIYSEYLIDSFISNVEYLEIQLGLTTKDENDEEENLDFF
jgi:DNA-binding response OmpR family regulator